MIVGAVACFSISDSISKALAARYPMPLLVWARWGAQVVAMLIWLAPTMGTRMVHTRQLPHAAPARRAADRLVACLHDGAASYLPLADATALNYLTPTLVILIAIVFLRRAADAARGSPS